MEYLDTPYLCGGVVFSLIVLVKSKGIARKHINGDKDFNSNPNIMLALEKAMDPKGTYISGSTHDKDTSKYLNCREEGDSSALAFNNAPCAQQFDDEIKKQNPVPVNRVAEFLNIFLPENYRLWLLKAMLEILESDPGITDNDVFFITGDGATTTKAQICNMNSFCLEAFMTGILHFIMMHRINYNYLGADTIEKYKLKKLNECQLGRTITRDIIIIPWSAPKGAEVEPVTDKPNGEISDADVIAAHTAQTLRDFFPAAARIIKERADEIREEDKANNNQSRGDTEGTNGADGIPAPDVCYEIPKQNTNQVTYIQHQTNVYQNAGPGGKNIHIDHLDTLEL